MKKFFFVLLSFVSSLSILSNNVLVQNVGMMGLNSGASSVQISYDLSWQNSWKDNVNWDAVWLFMKYKDLDGVWKHAHISSLGNSLGQGTQANIDVPSDGLGAFVFRSQASVGDFNIQGAQLRWNFGQDNVVDPLVLEIRLMAIEMVYVPQGDYVIPTDYRSANAYYQFIAPGYQKAVISNRMSPTLNYKSPFGTRDIRIKGDLGIDYDNDGVVDNVDFPTGYKAFYCCKYEMSEQQYTDFLSMLSSQQVGQVGMPYQSWFNQNQGKYYTTAPNRAVRCSDRSFLYYAQWSGLRPLSILEIFKVSYGPVMSNDYSNHAGGSSTSPVIQGPQNVGSSATSSTNRAQSGSSYYGVMDLTGNLREPVVDLSSVNFSYFENGTGSILQSDDIEEDFIGSCESSGNDYTFSYENAAYICGNGGDNWYDYFEEYTPSSGPFKSEGECAVTNMPSEELSVLSINSKVLDLSAFVSPSLSFDIAQILANTSPQTLASASIDISIQINGVYSFNKSIQMPVNTTNSYYGFNNYNNNYLTIPFSSSTYSYYMDSNYGYSKIIITGIPNSTNCQISISLWNNSSKKRKILIDNIRIEPIPPSAQDNNGWAKYFFYDQIQYTQHVDYLDGNTQVFNPKLGNGHRFGRSIID